MKPVIPGLLLVLGLALGVLGCSEPDEFLLRAEEAMTQQDSEAAQAALREGLERHPNDLGLLCAAAEFHLRGQPESHYKPRLALHYALRADRAAEGRDRRAASVLLAASKAAGGLTALPEFDRLLRAGLEQIDHPDAESPKHLRHWDPDLLEPTLKNAVEQKLRWEKGRELPTCPPDHLLVPEGDYEGPAGAAGPALTTPAFCIQRGVTSDRLCEAEGVRACTTLERAVVSGSLAPALSGSALGPRCCSTPYLSRRKP